MKLATNMKNRASKQFDVNRADIVFADKNRRGSRAISEIGIFERTLYRALVELIRNSLPAHIAERSEHRAFRAAPLAVDSARYVSSTDISSYYEFVDHEALGQELEAQSGEALAIDSLLEVLGALMGRRVGLPQIHASSDVLGDTYIDVVRRRLVRAGYAAFSYSDDFRIATPTLADAKSALEMCAREARELGLTLNESKTYTFGREKYVSSLEDFSSAELQLFTGDELRELEVVRLGVYEPLADVDEYSDEEAGFGVDLADPGSDEDLHSETEFDVAGLPSIARTEAAEKALSAWLEQVGAEDQEAQLIATTESLLRVSLPILGAAASRSALPHISLVLRLAPSLTPAAATYLIMLSRTGRAARVEVQEALDVLIEESAHSDWQRAWLAEAAGWLRSAGVDREYHRWLRNLLMSERSGLAAVAAASMGRLGIANVSELQRLLDAVHPAWRHLVLWGLAKQDGAAAMSVAEDMLERSLVAATVENPR
ncbi:reverse transcriptase domain-containing protein [Agrococcus baldri]|uniref:reverse transcriptase domain-containing protein n=1 Tax=Agrococcus baldri TaxID=153730 RepID=UPI0015A6B766|nr:RNA-directed DNA polymerase [Agrococcus baldri]